jgi:ubiquinol-cytochrome c reductase cytochrome c1 subunit
MMRVVLLLCLIWLYPAAVVAQEVPLERVDIDLADKAALQDGARTFASYCMGCHSAKFQRYERVADDLGIPHEQMLKELVFTGAKIGDPMVSSLPASDGKLWFGAAPPDLTLVARVRGNDWLYGYLRGFYPDATRPWGVNNHVLPDVGMPNVLEPLQARLTAAQFDAKVKNLVGFLAYSANPVKVQSQRIGLYVLSYLVVLLGFAFMLKREYWKDVR